MGHLWDIAQAHLDEYGVRAAALARRMGTSPQTLDSWKNRGVRSLPSKALLEALARETRTPYEEVLDAALRDIDYLPKESDRDGNATPIGDGDIVPPTPIDFEARRRKPIPTDAAARKGKLYKPGDSQESPSGEDR